MVNSIVFHPVIDHVDLGLNRIRCCPKCLLKSKNSFCDNSVVTFYGAGHGVDASPHATAGDFLYIMNVFTSWRRHTRSDSQTITKNVVLRRCTEVHRSRSWKAWFRDNFLPETGSGVHLHAHRVLSDDRRSGIFFDFPVRRV